MGMPRGLKETIRGMLPRRVAARRIWGGPLRGERLYTSWYDYPGALLGTTERPLLEWFGRHVKAGETWLDVGAHYGYTALALSRLTGRAGRVFAFEPVAGTVECLEKMRSANGLEQLRIVAVALSDSKERSTLRLPETRGMADRTLSGGTRFETIAHQALDTLWPVLAQGRVEVHGVKVDVQGMEGEALAGMRGVLSRWRPKLVVEFHAGVDREPILGLLRGCGYGAQVEAIGGSGGGELEDDRSYAFWEARGAQQARAKGDTM